MNNVHIDMKGKVQQSAQMGAMMNTIVTSSEALLDASKKIAAEKGIKAINMRAVAGKAGVSVGSVYNYFPNKAVLVGETIAEIWCDVFHRAGGCSDFTSFHDCFIWLIETIDQCCSEYPDFLTAHAAGIEDKEEREKSRLKMEQYFKHIQIQLKSALINDKKVKKNIFTETFREDEFIRFIFDNILMLLSKGDKSCSVLVWLVDTLLYR